MSMLSVVSAGWRRQHESVLKAPAYTDRVRALFADPRHAGEAAGTRVRAARGGFAVELSADADDGVLARLRFRVFGCPHLVAAAEAFCEHFEGKVCADLAHFSARDLLEELGIPVEKTGRILLLEDAVRALGARLGPQPAPTDTD